MAGAPSDGASSIQVTIRVRPFTIREAAQLTKSEESPLFLGDGSLAGAPTAPRPGAKGLRSVVKVMDEKCLVFDPPEDNAVQRFGRTAAASRGKAPKDQTFGFDRVFDDNTNQSDVYESTTKNLLDSVLDGYNATVFAYGATGCGKTHTITGSAQQPGIIFLTMQELFEKVEDLRENKECEVTLSYLEIYNEAIRDLLSPGANPKQGLMLREDANQAVSVAGLSSHKPQNVEEVMDMVIKGNANRTQSPTEANATSSRSHAVLQINVSLKDRNASTSEPLTFATLSIIDLAGSERASATKNRGERLLEGANINKSLLALGSCINALCDPRKKNHVPYRNSKLTRLLKFSLGGNCRTVMIVCISPSSQHFDETQNTLRYANRAKNIQTKSVRNVYNVDRHVKDYLKKIDEQMTRINELTAQQKQYEELAFVKFRKAEAKRTEIAHEGVQRIRAGYDNSAGERTDRMNNMKRLRQIERRIGAISGWIGAFDQMCDTREDEDPPKSLTSMRKTAQGILVELEGSRQHFHQRLGRNNWTRAIDTALQDGLRQLQSLDGAIPDGLEDQSLRKEVEIIKVRAETEMNMAVLEQERTAEAGLMQVMLSANFETVAILNQILQMDEEEAVQAAKGVLGKLLTACTEASSQVIKPDGGLQIVEAVPPTKNGTPKKRKQVPLMGPSPLRTKSRPSLAAPASAVPSHMASEIAEPSSSAGSSPAKFLSSPRRRVKLGGARKGVNFAGTPKKKSPSKKRAVHWRDDTGDDELVEFKVSPQKFDTTPDNTVDSLPAPSLPPGIDDNPGSSPLPAGPDLPKTGSGRFATGFLSKKSPPRDHSSPPPTLSSAALSPPSSDTASPLRPLPANSTTNPRQSPNPTNNTPNPDPTHPTSDTENHPTSSSPETSPPPSLPRNPTQEAKSEARALRAALRKQHKRPSASARAPSATHSTAPKTTRSSPPPEAGPGQGAIFSASHARRMVGSGAGSDGGSASGRGVLSPRSAPVVKRADSGVRRSLMETSSGGGAAGGKGHVRVSSGAVGRGGKGWR